CGAADSHRVLFSRLSILALRVPAIPCVGAQGHAGFFLRRIFLPRLVDLFHRLFSCQDADRHSGAHHRFPGFIPPRPPTRTTRRCVPFATAAFYLCCHDPGEDQYWATPHPSGLPFSVALGLAPGDGPPISRLAHTICRRRACALCRGLLSADCSASACLL